MGISPSDSTTFESTLSVNVNLPSSGQYEASFDVLMYCDQTNCETAEDYIQLNILPGLARAITVNQLADVNLANIGVQKQWRQKSMPFYAGGIQKDIPAMRYNPAAIT